MNFSQFTPFMKWNVKNCFVKLILTKIGKQNLKLKYINQFAFIYCNYSFMLNLHCNVCPKDHMYCTRRRNTRCARLGSFCIRGYAYKRLVRRFCRCRVDA